jgi:hypothetical protein
VFEDIAIAAHVMALWPPGTRFVDLGCGNGFLCHIRARSEPSRSSAYRCSSLSPVTHEGHPGIGIDLQPRRIWARFDPPYGRCRFSSRVSRVVDAGQDAA